MKPEIILLMLSSVDGGLHPSRWTASPDGSRRDWSGFYETMHDTLGGDGWIVGRVTMAEMSKAGAHPPISPGPVERPVHVATRDAAHYAVAVDPSARLHFDGGMVGGDHVVVLLGSEVGDGHLAELAADGVSYIVSATRELDLAAMLETLNRDFGIERLLLEGGGAVNGGFLAAGLVDEAHILIAPALDGGTGAQSIVSYPAGLAGRCSLTLMSAETMAQGVVHLHYRVSAA